MTAVISCQAATALSARASCTYPQTAFSTTTAAITIASTGKPFPPPSAQARSEMVTGANRR